MGEILDAASIEWQPVRPDVARGVFGRTLLADGARVVLTRVAPGGEFTTHRDDYGHLFYFLSGEGTVTIEGKQSAARAGIVARVEPGQAHAYANTGGDDLLLISLNLPAK